MRSPCPASESNGTTEGGATPSHFASPARVIAAIGGIYVAQSVVGGVTFTGLPAVLRQAGLSLNDIGLILLTVVPWSFKFLWAPAIERYRLPPGGARHRSRSVVLVGGFVAAGGLAGAGVVGPTALGLLMTCLTLAAFATATVDIACDGYAVESLAERHRGWGNAAQVAGAYGGSAIGGGAFLILVDHAGWTVSTLAMAATIVLLGLPFILGPDGRRPARHEAERPNLSAALRRREVRYGLLLVALYVMGQKWAMVLIGPYLVDAGLSLSLIGLMNGFGGMAVGIAGALLGGAAVKRFGGARVALASLAAQALIIAAFAVSAIWAIRAPGLLGGLAIANSGVMALGFVALYARLMGYASLTQAGVDFTLFQCADAVVSLIGWQLASAFGDRLGYGWCFGIAAAVALVATATLPAAFRRADAAG